MSVGEASFSLEASDGVRNDKINGWGNKGKSESESGIKRLE